MGDESETRHGMGSADACWRGRQNVAVMTYEKIPFAHVAYLRVFLLVLMPLRVIT